MLYQARSMGRQIFIIHDFTERTPGAQSEAQKMNISFSDVARVKREAKQLRSEHPDLSHGQRLDLASAKLLDVRGFHELKRHWEKSMSQHLVEKASGVAACTFCGLEFVRGMASERNAHSKRHGTFEEAIGVLKYVPQHHAEREAGKAEGYELMREAEAEKRFEGALLVLRAWFDRSLVSAISDSYWKAHPSFDQYVAYMAGNLDGFPQDVVDALAAKYGRKDGVIPRGRSYWYPPKKKRQG